MSYSALSAMSSHPTRCTDDTELISVIRELQGLRKTLHEQFIVEEASLHRHPHRNKQLLTASTPISSTENDKFKGVLPNAPPASELHRTLDNPTLSLLKSVNYPFSLCEEAPPSYTPPSVPFDVESEVEQLKHSVLQVQAELQEYVSHLTNTRENDANTSNNVEKSQTTAATSSSSRKTSMSSSANMQGVDKDWKQNGKGKITQRDALNFFSSNAHFAELAWNVSSLQWFYRWVLSHSISLLWNAKEQLEYVLTESGQALPSSVDEMDRCLAEYPFSAAVAILDNDRQMVIAEERRKLNTTISRTYKDRLPVGAVKIATSCYLSAEEKYMYQEFYNQSEHLLLLLRHSQLLEVNEQNNNNNNNNNSNHNVQSKINRHKSISDESRSSASKENISIAYVIAEVKAALKAEKEMIIMLLDTITQRRRDNVFYDISEEEYARSRQAAIAVYGCVASDISLMAFQMTVAAEFLNKYEEWLRYHGFASHDALMSELCKHNLNAEWPLLDAYTCHTGHANHFVPPTSAIAQMEWMRLNSNVMPEANLLVRDNTSNDKSETSTSASHREMEEEDKQANRLKAENKNKICLEPLHIQQHIQGQQQQQQQQDHIHNNYHPFILSPLPLSLSSTSETSPLPSIENEQTMPAKKHAEAVKKECSEQTEIPFTHSSAEKPEARELLYNNQGEENQYYKEEQEQKEINRGNNSSTPLPVTSQQSKLKSEDPYSKLNASSANEVKSKSEFTTSQKTNNEQVESVLHTFVHILREVVERYIDMCRADKAARFEHFSICTQTLPPINTVQIRGVNDKNLQVVKDNAKLQNVGIVNKNLKTHLCREAQAIREKLLDKMKECVKSLEAKILWIHSITMRRVDCNDNKESTVEHFVQDVIRFTYEVSNLYDANLYVPPEMSHSSRFLSSDCESNKNSYDDETSARDHNRVNAKKKRPELVCAFSISVNLNTITSPELQTCQNVNGQADKYNGMACFNPQRIHAFVERAMTLHNVAMWLRVHEMILHNAELLAINKSLSRSAEDRVQIEQRQHEQEQLYNQQREQQQVQLQQKIFVDRAVDGTCVNKKDSAGGLCTNSTNRVPSTLRNSIYFRPAHILFLPISRIRSEENEYNLNSIVIEFGIPETDRYSKKRGSENELQNQQELVHQQMELEQQEEEQESQLKESANSAISLHALLSEYERSTRDDKVECKAQKNKLTTNVRYALARWVICAFHELSKNQLLSMMRCDAKDHQLKLISLTDYIFLQRAEAKYLLKYCDCKENSATDLKELQTPSSKQRSSEVSLREIPVTIYIVSPYALNLIRWQTLCKVKLSKEKLHTHDARNYALNTSKQCNLEQSYKELWSVYYQLAEVLCDIASSNLPSSELSLTRFISICKSDNTSQMHLRTLQLVAEQIKDDAFVLQQGHHEQEHSEELKLNEQRKEQRYEDDACSNNVNDRRQKELIAKITKLDVHDDKQTEYAVKRLNFSAILEHLDDYIIKCTTPKQLFDTMRESIYTGDAHETSL